MDESHDLSRCHKMKSCRLKDQSLKFHAEKNAKRCCVVRANTNVLHFPPGDNPRKVQHLTRVFKQQGCDRANERHVIPGNITGKELKDALAYSNLSFDDLRSSQRPPLLSFPPGTFIRCAQGRSRVAALTQTVQSGELWWPVELFIDLSEEAFKALTEAFEHESSPSDGQICWKIYESYCRDRESENRWWTRLSKSKAGIFRRLLKHEYLLPKFMLVLQIPGMRDGLQLGTILEIISSKMDEQVGHYLQHTYATCAYIMGSCEELQLMDTTTVEVLESRAPGQSQKDYDYISRAMEYGVIFKDIRQEHKKREILECLGQLSGLFTTLHTLQQDCKYIRQCGRVLRTLVLGETEAHNDMSPKQTVQQMMTTSFTRPLDPWEPVSDFENSLKLLYLHIMRDLEPLSGEYCLLEDGERTQAPLTRNHKCWFELAKRATALGFESENIKLLTISDPHLMMAKEMLELKGFEFSELKFESYIRTIAMILAEAQPKQVHQRSPHLTSDIGELIKRRCGRQYTNAYNSDRFNYTVSIINWRNVAKGRDITSLFVWKSKFHAFLGYDMIEIGLGDEPVDPSHENNLWVDCDDADESMSEPTPAHRNSPNVNAEYTLHTDPEGREQPSDQESTPFITDVHMADSTVQRPTAPAKREINMLRQRTARSAAIPSHIAQSRVQKSTKPAKTKLLAASAPELRQSLIPNEPSDEGMAEDGGISMTVGNLAVTQLPSNNQLGPEKRSNIPGCTQVPVNEVRVYYLEDNCWKLVGSHSRESIGRAVRTFLRQSGNALYLFDSEERGIQPSDCHEVGDPAVCITSDSKGFGDAGPPEEVEL